MRKHVRVKLGGGGGVVDDYGGGREAQVATWSLLPHAMPWRNCSACQRDPSPTLTHRHTHRYTHTVAALTRHMGALLPTDCSYLVAAACDVV